MPRRRSPRAPRGYYPTPPAGGSVLGRACLKTEGGNKPRIVDKTRQHHNGTLAGINMCTTVVHEQKSATRAGCGSGWPY